MELTATEKRLEGLLGCYQADLPRTRELTAKLVQLTQEYEKFLPCELVAFSIAQHASALIAAQKMATVMRPELANAIAEDFRHVVICRSLAGVPCVLNKGISR